MMTHGTEKYLQKKNAFSPEIVRAIVTISRTFECVPEPPTTNLPT